MVTLTWDQIAELYLAGFCSSTEDFNGDTHGHNVVAQPWIDHADNFAVWLDELGIVYFE